MCIRYKHVRSEKDIECLLISINFDDEVMELQPIGENYYQQSFFTSIKNCFISLRKLKAVAINGVKVKEEQIPTCDNKVLQNFKSTHH